MKSLQSVTKNNKKETRMKILSLAACLFLAAAVFLVSGCSKQGTLEYVDTTIDEVVQKMDAGETFTLLVVRDNCPYCEAMKEYLEETKEEHGDLTIYRINTTDYELYRENEGDRTLVSENDAGKLFLEKFPYFLYTPTFYKIVDGTPVSAGVGFDESTESVALWGVDSTADLTNPETQKIWTFLEGSDSN